MPITPLPPYVASFLPLSNITPFTYKDGETYLKLLTRMQEYLTDTLIPYVNDNFEALGEDFQTQVNLVIDTVNTQLAAQDAAVTAELAAQLATMTAALALKADLVTGKVPDSQLPAYVAGVTAGPHATVDSTDPKHPVVGVTGVVLGVTGSGHATVDNTDPTHPIVGTTGVVLGVTAGANATVNNTDPTHPIVSGTGVVQAIVAGANVAVNNSDPTHPVVSASGGGGGGGIVASVVAGTHINVNSTDPANPVISATGLVDSVSAGSNISVNNTDPDNPIISTVAKVTTVVAGSHISVNNTDPNNPVVSTTGLVDSVTAGTNISVNNTDPDNPIISTTAKVGAVVAGSNISVNNTDPVNPVVSTVAKVTSVVAGTNVTVDNTDPNNPIVAAATPAFTAPESATDPGSPVEGKVYANTRRNRVVPYINGAYRHDKPMIPHGSQSTCRYTKVNQTGSSTWAFGGDVEAWKVTGTTGFLIASGSGFNNGIPGSGFFSTTFMGAISTAGTAAVVALSSSAQIGPYVPATLTSPINKTKWHARLRGGVNSGAVNANNRFLMGWDISAGGTTDANPSANLGFIGVGWDAADTVLQIMRNDSSGTATKTATTINARNKTAPTQSELNLDLEIDIYFNGTAWEVTLTVTDMLAGTTQTATFTTDLFASDSTPFAPVVKASSGGISWGPTVRFIDHFVEMIA